MRTLQIKRIKSGEQFKPIGHEYAAYTKTPSTITGVKIRAPYPYIGKLIGCKTEEGQLYNMHERQLVIRW